MFGEQFTSWQNALERTAGIVTGPLVYLLEIPLGLLNVIMMALDGMCEFAKGNFSEAGDQVFNILEQGLVIFAPLLAVISLINNLVDVGCGIGNTLIDATNPAPSMP